MAGKESETIELQLGDLFLTHSPTQKFIDKAIIWFSKLGSVDFDSYYTHAGIIIYPDGLTFESKWPKIKAYNIFSEHKGDEVLIARHKLMCDKTFRMGYNHIYRYNDNFYPVWRWAAYATRTEKLIHWTSPVCSELVAMFLHYSIDTIPGTLRPIVLFKKTGKFSVDFSHWWGISPDNLADCFEKWVGDFDIIWKGIL